MPRTEVVWIERTKTVPQALALALRSGFSRIPVTGENADDMIGVAYLKDLARRAQDTDRARSTTVEEVMRAHAVTLPSVEIRFNHELSAFQQDANQVRARVKDLRMGKEIEVRCDYLVGADGARFHHLIGLQHEILAQHRQMGRGARGLQIVVTALEVIFLRQHGQAGSTALRVGAGQGRGVEVGADQSC